MADGAAPVQPLPGQLCLPRHPLGPGRHRLAGDRRLAGLVPVLGLLILLGGVSRTPVGQAVLVLAATALAAGSLGNLVALWRVRTFQALALTVLFIVLYLSLVHSPAALLALALAA